MNKLQKLPGEPEYLDGIKTENWIPTSQEQPPQGIVVMTKIDDASGSRNVQCLKRDGRLYFTHDGKMYVYYTPTHWIRES